MSVGRGSSIGLAKETTWGTPVSRTNWLKASSLDLQRLIDKQPVPVLDLGGPTHRDFFDASDNVAVRFTTFPTYENFGMLWESIFGALATTGPSGSDYTHTYTLAAAQPTGMTLEGIQGNAANSLTFEGMRTQRARFSVDAGGLSTLECDLIGETHAAPATAGTASYGAGQTYIPYHHFGQFGFNSNNISLASFEMEINNGTTRYPVIGSKLTGEPDRGAVEVTGRLSLKFADHTQYSEFTADTQGDATLTAATGSLSFAITLQNMIWTAASHPISAHGAIVQTFEWRCFGDGTDNGVKLVIINTSASGTAN